MRKKSSRIKGFIPDNDTKRKEVVKEKKVSHGIPELRMDLKCDPKAYLPSQESLN